MQFLFMIVFVIYIFLLLVKKFEDVSFPLPNLSPPVPQQYAEEEIKKVFFQGKHLPSCPPGEYPDGMTKAAVCKKWLEVDEEGFPILIRLAYAMMFIRGIFAY